jgi:hypothetical protein
MGKVTFLAAQVPANPTYNWTIRDAILGELDIGLVSTTAPGVGPGAGVNAIQTSVAPLPVFQPFLGQQIQAVENTLGAGEFVYLAVPTSTAIPLGTLVTWEFGPSGTQYSAVVLPAGSSSANSGAPLAVCIASTVANSGLGITSNATQVQYAWFQTGGAAQVLKTAIQVPPVATATGDLLFISATAGRVYITASAGKAILGSRRANQTTVTATASCLLVYLNGRPVVEGT